MLVSGGLSARNRCLLARRCPPKIEKIGLMKPNIVPSVARFSALRQPDPIYDRRHPWTRDSRTQSAVRVHRAQSAAAAEARIGVVADRAGARLRDSAHSTISTKGAPRLGRAARLKFGHISRGPVLGTERLRNCEASTE
jgi:hypothetical protein